MKITGNITLLESTKGSYVYLIEAEEPVLVDTGFSWQGKGILRELAAMQVPPESIRHILLTHYDLDHIGNAAMLQKRTGARLWASEGDAPYILGQKPRPGFKKYLPYVFRTPKPKDISTFRDGDIIGGIRVIHTPGHTPGHVCLLCNGVLFAGDLVKSENGSLIPYRSGWNWDSVMLLDSIRKINNDPFQWVCPAHGRPVKTANILCPAGSGN